MSETRYFVTQYKTGFRGDGNYLGPAMKLLQHKLRTRATGLYHRQQFPNHEEKLPDLMKTVKQAIAEKPIGHKEVIFGSHYDEPAFAIKSKDVSVVSPMITWAEQFVGKAGYLVGAPGPPGPGDCSQLTQNAAWEALGIHIPDTANEQGHSPALFHYFDDPGDLESGDFIWFHYTDRVGPSLDAYDHVEFFVRHGLDLGSRPSTSGTNYYPWVYVEKPDWAVVKYGRLVGA